MSRWIMPHNVTDAPVRLFCFPYAGGGASAYRRWIRESEGSVYAMQPPGRENRVRDPLRYSLTEWAAEAAEAVLTHTDRPYAFFGHSLGARVAFETAREIRRRGGPLPVHLFVSGSPAPDHCEERPLHRLDDAAFTAELKRFSGTPAELLENADIMAFFLPILRADFTVDETYAFQPEDPLPVPITAFCGSEDREATPPQMRAWRNFTSADFALRLLPGDHFFLFRPENRLPEQLHAMLRQCACPLCCTPASPHPPADAAAGG